MIRLCLFLLATVIHGEVTNVRPIRVAILVDGRHDLVVALIEQVEVRLSRLTDVAMLDRSSLNQVLAEHALSVSGLLNRDQAVEAGRLLGADVLILATDRKEYLSWRIIDVSTGFLLGLHILPQPVSPDEAEAASVAGEIAKGLAKARLPRDKTLLISVARFINRDVTREYDALQTVLPELMSRILSDVPNMILLEREDLVRLDQEKAWEGADLQGYEEGMLLIEGDYRTDRRAGHHRLETHVLVRTRTGEQVAEVRVKGEAEDPLTLVRDLVSALLRRLNLGAGPEAELGAGREARRFMMKAAFFRDQQDFLSAADMTETAFYLEPDNPVYRERVIRARQDVMRGYINWSADPREIARRLGYFIRAVEDGRRLLENNDPLLEKIGDDRLYHSAVFGRGCWASEQKELLRQARTAYLDAWSAHRRWLRQRLVDSGCDEKWQRRYRDAIHLHMRAFLNDELFDRPDDIRKHLRMLLEDVVWLDEACAAPVGRPMPHTADFLPELLSSIGYPYEKPESPAWDALKAVREEVLEEWAADTRPWIGFYAKVALAAYRSRVKEDLVVGRRMAEEAIRELTRYDVSLNDWVYSDICFAVTGESGFWDLSAVVMAIRNVTQRDPALHSRALDGLVSRVCNLLLAKIASQPHFEEWSDIVLQHLSRSLAEGEEAYVRQMVTSLMDYTASARASEGDASSFRAALVEWAAQRGIPAKGSPLREWIPGQPAPILVRNRKASIRNRLPGQGVALCARNNHVYAIMDDHFSKSLCLVQADLATGQARHGEFVDLVSLLRTPNSVARKYADLEWDGDRIWLCLANHGLYEFGLDGSAKVVDTANIFPANTLTCIAVKEKRMFVGFKSAVGEWDREEGTLRILCSSREENGTSPLDGGKLYDVIDLHYDARLDRLLILVNGGDRSGLWCYWPADKRWAMEFALPESAVTDSAVQGDCLYVLGWPAYLLVYDLLEPRDHVVCVYSPYNDRFDISQVQDQSRVIKSSDAIFFWPALFMGNTLVFSHNRQGLYLWPLGAPEPQQVQTQGESDDTARNTAGLAPSPRGFIFASFYGLWNINMK